MTVSQILQEARAQIAAGWCQGTQKVLSLNSANEITHQRYCLWGALVASSADRDEKMRAADVIAAHLPNVYNGSSPGPAIWSYNDALGRTQAEVLSLLDAALTEVTK